MRLLSTLQRTLSLHFLLVAVLPALVLGMIAISLLHNHLENGVYERNRQLSGEIAATAEQFLMEVELDLGTVAGVLGDGAIIRPTAIDAYLDEVVRRSAWVESIYLLDEQRRVRHLGYDPRSQLRRDDLLATDFSHHETFIRNPVIDRPVWSDSFVSVLTGEPSVSLAIPVGSAVLLGNISLQSLGRQLQRFTPDERDHCAIVDHAGTLVASSDAALAMQRANYNDHPAIERVLHGGKMETILERHGSQTVLESTALIERTGWVAWIGVDMGARMAPVDDVRNLLIGILVMALMLAAGIALLDARRLMRPLLTFSEQAGQIGAGRYDVDLPPSGFIEIDRLAVAMQEMSHAVRDRELSLLDSEQRFRDLVNSIDGMVWELDIASGSYLFVSEQSEAMFGYPSVQWLDDPGFWAGHVHPEDLGSVVVHGSRNLTLRRKHDLEYRFITAQGRPMWVRDLITVIREGDEAIRLLGVTIDISQRKLVEGELQRYRDQLEELVAQRTSELKAVQRQLVEQERLAVLGQLTATVSHEIRNPLGTVANALFLLRETLGEECLTRVERALALAERNVERCDGIISELLDFSRRRELHFETIPLDRWLTEFLGEMFWPPAVSCVQDLAGGIVVQADPERLRRALVNVITNALQAMEGSPGRQELAISTRRLADRCEIVVRDSGCGIPPELMDRIFEPLFSTKNFGVGLGVPIIRNIMTDHGGGVDYRSRPGEGTTVTLWLPLANPAESAET